MTTEIPAGWRVIERENGVVEWQCPHGVGHPAPVEHQPENVQLYLWGWAVHGCDGCCVVHEKTEIIARTKSSLADWHNPVFDGPPDKSRSVPNDLKLNTEGDE